MKHQRKMEATSEVKARVLPSVKRDAEAENKSISLDLKMPNKETRIAMDDLKNRIGLKAFNNGQEILDDLHSEDE